jgi:hypothetical protein
MTTETIRSTTGASSSSVDQECLVRSLTAPSLFGPWCTGVRVIETHISYVLLTGRYAYKIKKAVALGFLDFSTLVARRFYCDRELALNRRLAPAIYLEVVAITGTVDAPRIGGPGPAIEYAVKMREFPQEALLTSVCKFGRLTIGHIDQLADLTAAFHHSAAASDPAARSGSPGNILQLARDNFATIEPLLLEEVDRQDLASIREWTDHEHDRHAALFAERQRSGFVRECHGDLHLGNIALVEGRITIFDCIEFNDEFRRSDVVADVAFLVMDLRDHGRPDLASRLLNRYLELTGDYNGLPLLRFYVVYRAMVRAKVAAVRATQTIEGRAHAASLAECREYLQLAVRCIETGSQGLLITHGFSGAGKTTQSEDFVELCGAIRIRTDVERKRLHGVAMTSPSGSGLNSGMYDASETERTYRTVGQLARTVVGGAYPVIVDGAFLQRRWRDLFRSLAAEFKVPFVIIDFIASLESLHARIERRRLLKQDASEADVHVLEEQLRVAEPLAPEEIAVTHAIDTERVISDTARRAIWQPVFDRLRTGRSSHASTPFL